MSSKQSAVEIEETEVDGLGKVRVGKLVKHPKFGNGTIANIAKRETGEVTINVVFKNVGSKWLVPEYARLSEPAQNTEQLLDKHLSNEKDNGHVSFFARLFKNRGK